MLYEAPGNLCQFQNCENQFLNHNYVRIAPKIEITSQRNAQVGDTHELPVLIQTSFSENALIWQHVILSTKPNH